MTTVRHIFRNPDDTPIHGKLLTKCWRGVDVEENRKHSRVCMKCQPKKEKDVPETVEGESLTTVAICVTCKRMVFASVNCHREEKSLRWLSSRTTELIREGYEIRTMQTHQVGDVKWRCVCQKEIF